MSAKAPAKGHTAKHAAASKSNAKHATTAKSGTKHAPAKQKKPVTAKSKPPAKVTAKAAPAKPAKAAGFAVGDLLPVCAFEAVAQSLRLAGQPVHDDEVAYLWELLGERPEGVPVSEALEAVSLLGVAGCGPLSLAGVAPFALGNVVADEVGSALPAGVHGLILHVDVPGPHAVLATADGWWSWGELFSPWPARVEAAWAVSWS